MGTFRSLFFMLIFIRINEVGETWIIGQNILKQELQ